MNLDKIEEILKNKTWVAGDDSMELSEVHRESIEQGIEPYLLEFKWTTETYIAHGQIQLAFEDSDVVISDIEAEENKPVIYLEWVGEEF